MSNFLQQILEKAWKLCVGVILRFYECGVKGKMKNGGKEENVAIKRDSGTRDEKRVENFVP